MTTQEIKEFLKLEYTKKNQNFNKYPIEVIETLLNIVNDLDHSNYEKSIKCKIAFYLSKHNIDTIPKCGYNNCTKPKEFIRISKGFKMGCCGNHTRKLSLLKKYGVENISYLVETKNKISKANKESALEAKIKRSKTNLEKFNVENTFNIADFRDKSINTNLEKYGVDHHTKSKEFQEKERIRCYEKTGYFHHSENPEVREKISKSNKIKGQEIAIKSRLTVRNRYGVDNISQLDEIKVKKKNTCLNNYGVLHPMHDEKIFEKNQKTRLTKKEYIWKTGDISIVQGYETIILAELEEDGYSFQDVKTRQVDIPTIWYIFKGKKKRYYPDIYIPNENLIIEVKSSYTYEINLEVNLLKEKACLDAGFNFRFEIR